MGALRDAGHTVLPVGITVAGRWQTGPNLLAAVEERQRDLQPLPELGDEVRLTARDGGGLVVPIDGAGDEAFDVVFPLLHGTYGEDGTVQGLFEMTGVPYVGAGVLASALSMDKALTKAVLRDAGIPVCRWLVTWPDRESPAAVAGRVEQDIGFPCFVKPANMGSSVGITKVAGPADLEAAVREAAAWDPKVVIEEAVRCREFECGVTGNEAPVASVVGELMPSREFYDYYDKYVGGGTTVAIPATLPDETAATMRRLALETFRAVDGEGLARIDFFLDRDSERVFVNEINTMPGFTSASMFPKLWDASGVPFPELATRLVELGLARHRARSARRIAFDPPQ
jgi:D-alanine-D-alanine ligase